jgi:hypothetical protein
MMPSIVQPVKACDRTSLMSLVTVAALEKTAASRTAKERCAVEDPAGQFARLAVELRDAATTGVAETAESLVQFAVQAIGCTSAALVLVRGGVLQAAAVSDPQLESTYQVEFETGEGPLVTAFTYDTVVRVRDAATDPRWPLWGNMIVQAMGILMERYRIDDDRAFAILRRYSQDTNTKLGDVAQLLIDTRKLPSVATPAEPAVKR